MFQCINKENLSKITNGVGTCTKLKLIPNLHRLI